VFYLFLLPRHTSINKYKTIPTTPIAIDSGGNIKNAETMNSKTTNVSNKLKMKAIIIIGLVGL